MGLSKIEKEPFIFCRYDLVTPVTRFSFVPNICAKNGQCISMIAVAGNHLPTCVATGEKDCNGQPRDAPKVGSKRCADRTQRWCLYQKSVPRAANRVVVSQGKFCRRALMGSATSRSVHQCSSKAARKFPETFSGNFRANANFAIEGRRARSQLSARSTARICAIDGANKIGAAAADELFHRSGQGIRASQPPRKILAETECLRYPDEKNRERGKPRPPS